MFSLLLFGCNVFVICGGILKHEDFLDDSMFYTPMMIIIRMQEDFNNSHKPFILVHTRF